MFWENKFENVPPIEDLTNLPSYSHSFLLRNLGPFKISFIILTIVTIVSTTSKFFAIYLISDVLSNIQSINIERLFTYYLPIFLALTLIPEFLDYFKRKYAEAIPLTYMDYFRLRFFKTILSSKFEKIFGYSKEKLIRVVNMYLDGVQKILYDWVCSTVGKMTQLVIVILIIGFLNPVVLLVNAVLIAIFLLISFRISKDFSKFAKEQTNVNVRSDSTIDSFLLNLNALKKNQLGGFFFGKYDVLIGEKWGALRNVRDFHAKRWLLQLVLFNLIHIGTLFYGLYAVSKGTIDLGFVLLIEWAYNQLWGIVVFVIEYRVELLQQKENSQIANETFAQIMSTDESTNIVRSDWEEIHIKNANVEFNKGNGEIVRISIPNFALRKGEKLGLIGKSGSGKSTLLSIILGLVRYEGDFLVDGKQLSKEIQLDTSDFTLIDNDSPFFNISLRENLLLGKNVDPTQLEELLERLKISDFEKNLDKNFGESVSSYSAGQMQRLRLARGILQDTETYLLDEPFNGIDKEVKAEIMDYLKHFFADKTVVLVTHIENELELTDSTYEIRDGVLRERG